MNAQYVRKLCVSIFTGALLITAILLVGRISPVRADGMTLFVRPGGTGTACAQANPCDLQTALAQAGDGAVIYLAQGTYTGAGAAVITITRSITLYGGWDGAAGGPMVRDPALYPTTLDGEGARRVVYIRGPAAVTIEGLTVTNGYATDAGAGVYARNTDLTLRRTTIYSNVVDSGSADNTFGGGAYVHGGSLYLSRSTFRNNNAWCAGCPFTKGEACMSTEHPVLSRTACSRPTMPGLAAA